MSDLVLEPSGPVVVGSRVRYPEPLSAYAARYSTDERTIKRWVASGRSANPAELPPLHNANAMPDWWGRHMRRRCPAAILGAAGADAPVVDLVTVQQPDPVVGDGEPVSKGFELNVEALRKNLAVAERMLNQAQVSDPPNEAVITARQRVYQSVFSELRKAEADLVEWRKATGDLIDRKATRRLTNRISADLNRRVKNLFRELWSQVSAKPVAEGCRIFCNAVDDCWRALEDPEFIAHLDGSDS